MVELGQFDSSIERQTRKTSMGRVWYPIEIVSFKVKLNHYDGSNRLVCFGL